MYCYIVILSAGALKSISMVIGNIIRDNAIYLLAHRTIEATQARFDVTDLYLQLGLSKY